MSNRFRVLYISDSPWLPTGYGKVSYYLMQYLKDKFDIIYLSITDPTLGCIKFNDVYVYRYLRGADDVRFWFLANKCHVCLLVKEPWVIPDIDKIPIHYILYAPFTQIEVPNDYLYYASLAFRTWLPSRYECEQVKKYGIEADYVPHGVNTSIYRPLDNIDELRKKYGFEGFDVVIGLFGMNTIRKMLPNQLEGIKIFIENNPDLKVGIYLHSTLRPIKEPWNGYNLTKIIERFELEDKVRVANQYSLLVGFDEQTMAELYNICDVVVDACYEGFGLHILEAQACGTPTVTLSIGGGAEINFLQLYVTKYSKLYTQLGTPVAIPDPYEIANAIERALRFRKEGIRDYLHAKAHEYDWKTVIEKYVLPKLEDALIQLWYKVERVGKKIAIVSSWGYRCGIAKFTQDLVKAFKEHSIYIIPIPTFRNCNDNDFIKYVIDNLVNINPNVVILELEYGTFGREGHEFVNKFITSVKNVLPNTKLITDMHVVDVYKGTEANVYLNSDVVIVHNLTMYRKLNKLVEEYGIEPKKTRTIPLCAEKITLSKDEAKKKLGIEPNVKIVSFVGFISPRKNIEVFFEVVKRLKDVVKNVKWVIVGGFHAEVETKYVKYVKKMCKELGIELTGYVSDEMLNLWIKASDVVIYPSYMVSSSGIVTRCIVNETPVIVLDCPAFRELDVLKASNIDEFVQLTYVLLTNDEVYNSYIKKLKQMSKYFECDEVVKQYNDLINDEHVTTYEVITCFKEWVKKKKEETLGGLIKIDFSELKEFCSEYLGKEVTIQKIAYVIRKVLRIEDDYIRKDVIDF